MAQLSKRLALDRYVNSKPEIFQDVFHHTSQYFTESVNTLVLQAEFGFREEFCSKKNPEPRFVKYSHPRTSVIAGETCTSATQLPLFAYRTQE